MIDQWRDFYPEAIGLFQHDMSEALGESVHIICYVDANQAGNFLNMRSHSGILIYINNIPLIWYPNRQNTLETLSFGSDFLAFRITNELVEVLRYKLRCFGYSWMVQLVSYMIIIWWLPILSCQLQY